MYAFYIDFANAFDSTCITIYENKTMLFNDRGQNIHFVQNATKHEKHKCKWYKKNNGHFHSLNNVLKKC